MRVGGRKLASAFLVVIVLGVVSVAGAATAWAGGTAIDEQCDIASPNNPACVEGTTEANDVGAAVDANVGAQSQGLALTGGDILLFTVFGLVALCAGAFVVMNRRRYAAVDADIE